MSAVGHLGAGEKKAAITVVLGVMTWCLLMLGMHVSSHGSDGGGLGRASPNEILDLIAEIDSVRVSLLAGDSLTAGDRLDLLAEYWVDLPQETLRQLTCPRGLSVGSVLVSEVSGLEDLIDAWGSRDSPSALSDEEKMELVLDGLSSIHELTPLVQAIADSSRSAMLVVSSVACRCVLARCSEMLELYAAIIKEAPGAQLANTDIMQSPGVDKVLGIGEVPAWVFIDATGCIIKISEGAADIAETRESLSDWIGMSN